MCHPLRNLNCIATFSRECERFVKSREIVSAMFRFASNMLDVLPNLMKHYHKSTNLKKCLRHINIVISNTSLTKYYEYRVFIRILY